MAIRNSDCCQAAVGVCGGPLGWCSALWPADMWAGSGSPWPFLSLRGRRLALGLGLACWAVVECALSGESGHHRGQGTALPSMRPGTRAFLRPARRPAGSHSWVTHFPAWLTEPPLVTLGGWTPQSRGEVCLAVGSFRTVTTLGLAFSRTLALGGGHRDPGGLGGSRAGTCRFCVFRSGSVLCFSRVRGRPGVWEEGGWRGRLACPRLPAPREPQAHNGS